MRSWMVMVLGLSMLVAFAPADASAQQRGNARRGVPVRVQSPPRVVVVRGKADRRDRDDIRLPWQVIRVESRGRNGQGPAFCRSGQGHPVFGRRWCLDKGYGLGGGKWGRVRWDDVVIRQPRRRETLRQRDLADILGDTVVGRFATHARYLGLGGQMTGAWVEEPNGPAVLRIMVAGVPIAEVVDANRVGRASSVLLSLGR